MGTIDFYGTIHIKRHQTSKEKIMNANALAHCKQALTISVNDETEQSESECKIIAIANAIAKWERSLK